MSPRSRTQILENLDAVYREAYERAKAAGDADRMRDLDAAYQREQLVLEVLLDVREALYTLGEASESPSALKKLARLRRLAKLE